MMRSISCNFGSFFMFDVALKVVRLLCDSRGLRGGHSLFNLSTRNILDPIILLHVVSTIFTSDPLRV